MTPLTRACPVFASRASSHGVPVGTPPRGRPIPHRYSRQSPGARGTGSSPATWRTRNPVINVVHVTLGTDSALRFDEERCTLLETIPASIPIEFLIDSSPGHLQAVLDQSRWAMTFDDPNQPKQVIKSVVPKR